MVACSTAYYGTLPYTPRTPPLLSPPAVSPRTPPGSPPPTDYLTDDEPAAAQVHGNPPPGECGQVGPRCPICLAEDGPWWVPSCTHMVCQRYRFSSRRFLKPKSVTAATNYQRLVRCLSERQGQCAFVSVQGALFTIEPLYIAVAVQSSLPSSVCAICSALEGFFLFVVRVATRLSVSDRSGSGAILASGRRLRVLDFRTSRPPIR